MGKAKRDLIEGRRYAPVCLGDVCVLGLGVSGAAVVDHLLCQPAGRVSSLTVFAGEGSAPTAETDRLEAAGATVIFSDEVTGRFSLCIASPGISASSSFYRSAQAASAELISEVELAWRESPEDARWVGITGTNGKTTTTALLAHLLTEAGFAAVACGNIGDACIHVVAQDVGGDDACLCGKQRIYVAEVSSYQLASIRSFAPEVGIFLGITPDHLVWHGSFEAYAEAKGNMLANMEAAGGCAILDATNDRVREEVKRLRRKETRSGFTYIPLGTKAGIGTDMRSACASANAAYLDDAHHLHVAYEDGEYALVDADGLQIRGIHNVVNALAASAAAIALGADAVQVTRALASFKPLEHRIEPAGEAQGVSFYNDSKATNVDATLVALTAFPGRPLIVMLGGRDKLGPLDELVDACVEHGKAVVVFGEAKERFEAAFRKRINCSQSPLQLLQADSFDEAFAQAVRVARAGDVVLLSPACASFDEFTCFEERGQHFKDLVRALGRADA